MGMRKKGEREVWQLSQNDRGLTREMFLVILKKTRPPKEAKLVPTKNNRKYCILNLLSPGIFVIY